MGAAHARMLAAEVPGAVVAEVYDLDVGRAEAIASEVGARAASSAQAVVDSAEVDAVVIASPDDTHAPLALACLDAGKPTLCEKPLSPRAEEAHSVVDAEVALGRRLIQLGFMRRYDPGFVGLREAIGSGSLGAVRLIHAVHRNVSSSTSTDSAGLITGSMVHELDVVAWLLDDELTAIRVESPMAEGFLDPQLATLWTRGGVMATVEVFVNARYGYDVRCEAVGTHASATLEPRAPIRLRTDGVDGVVIRDDFVAHFADAYRRELTAWVRAARDTGAAPTSSPSAWDGYVAAVAARAGVDSLTSGTTCPITPGPRPAIYADPSAIADGST